MSSVLLQVENLTLASSRGPIIQNLSFQISRGEIVALTGKSGSGKTSIAMAILDLLPAGIQKEAGTIRWLGKFKPGLSLPHDHVQWASLRGAHIGYTQQDVFGAFDPVLRIGKQMMMIVLDRASGSEAEAEKELRMKMEEVGLHDLDRLWNSYPHQLSGGQLQRCQIAMSIIIQPELLISDEPTSAIDKINQLELLDVFSMLKSRYNTAILCITHEEAVIRHLAEREIQLDPIDHEFPLPEPVSRESGSQLHAKLLEVKGLIYTHKFGGMMYKQGATIGELDFTLSRSKCLGIVGESGSGKSTLAQLLVGMHEPSHGRIILEGKILDLGYTRDVRLLRSKVQLVMQDGRGALHPYMTIRTLFDQVVNTNVDVERKKDIDYPRVLEKVGLPESVLDRTSQKLSGGECLRVNIARALLMQPEILICDESTSALDGPTRDAIVELLLHLMKSHGLALVFISHDERIIRGVADEILVLAHGKVVEQGPAAEVINHPTHPVTKKIFGLHATFGNRKSP